MAELILALLALIPGGRTAVISNRYALPATALSLLAWTGWCYQELRPYSMPISLACWALLLPLWWRAERERPKDEEVNE